MTRRSAARPGGPAPRRSASLRLRVALASGLASLVVVVLVGVLASVLLTREQTDRLDRSLVPGSPAVLGTFASTRADLAVTLRGPSATRRVSGPELPLSPVGIPTSVDVGGVAYRIRTAPGPTPGVLVTVGATEDDTRARVADRQRLVLGLGVVAVALAAGLGWLFAGRAVRPMRRLTAQAATLDGAVDPDVDPPVVRADGSRESEELADALSAMLARLHAEQERSTASLHAARDFAAAARHELRTPLTAMRTDLEVLQAHPDLPEREAVLADVQRAQARVEATLTALGQLAAGDLPDSGELDAVGVADVLRLAAEDARRAHPELAVVVDEPPERTITVSLEGLRMALANAVVNAVRHGGAGSVRLGAHAGEDGGVVLTVDDDGRGLPASEREAVLGRFVRGSTAGAPGSGLGLALIAQQAARHGGEVRLEDAPSGGLRVSLAIGPDRAG
ncbi:signal transduction histidine kinase [Actinomycetospora succinea]|uniref:Signal transduction histidine-protein kinase/phosphatase MprB n=1 Tax=Actinomycetospora succinea TaxID=663603 RepID=A0A4R6VJ19_9PSEU|nr:HAMP domain-containing sensor histidine kinase [Actinomycetospora succinea]TDQ63267.1 signal transduction histidine kinase [Actinomycetospora succinea]